MNANELAEQLDEYVGNNGYSHNDYADSMSQASTMLRQQQAEIEALKAVLEQEGIGVGRDLLNGGIALFRKAQEK